MAYIGEFLGTMLLVLIGTGVVANVILDESGMKGGGTVQITIAWGLAVMIPAYIFGASSGAHFNPALTLGLAVDGSIGWNMVPGYIICQFGGAFVGAIITYLMFKSQFDATEDQGAKLGVFATSPAVLNIPLNIFNEAVATFLLVFSIKGIGQMQGLPPGISNFFVFGIIVSMGMSFGGLTGYAMNPARDIGPRLAHQVLPIKDKGDSNWSYAIVPLVGPILGSLVAVLLYGALPWPV